MVSFVLASMIFGSFAGRQITRMTCSIELVTDLVLLWGLAGDRIMRNPTLVLTHARLWTLPFGMTATYETTRSPVLRS